MDHHFSALTSHSSGYLAMPRLPLTTYAANKRKTTCSGYLQPTIFYQVCSGQKKLNTGPFDLFKKKRKSVVFIPHDLLLNPAGKAKPRSPWVQISNHDLSKSKYQMIVITATAVNCFEILILRNTGKTLQSRETHDSSYLFLPKSFRRLSSLMFTLMPFTAAKASSRAPRSGWPGGVEPQSSHSSSGYFITRWIGLIIKEPMSSKFGLPLRCG